MQSTKQSNKLKSRVIAYAVCIAFILCTVLTLGFIPTPVVHADGENVIPQKVNSGIRFVQVAAGEDFAIGLTFDRKLYGWSLKPAAERNTSSPQTLGDYYGDDPKEINVTFRVGPGKDATPNPWNTQMYYEKLPSGADKIKAIATTRYTAAFISEQGYIYTWGTDNGVYRDIETTADQSSIHYILLRHGNESSEETMFEPYIINYFYYDSGRVDQSFRSLMPTHGRYTPIDIAGGEFGYMLLLKGNYTSGTFAQIQNYSYFTFVWGSVLYGAANLEPSPRFEFPQKVPAAGNERKIYKTVYAESNGTSTDNKPTIVAGGYTVGINGTAITGGTSLQLHGKNFLTSQDVTSTGTANEYSVKNTTQVVSPAKSDLAEFNGIPQRPTSERPAVDGPAVADIKFNGNVYKSSIAGNTGAVSPEDELNGFDTERFYARQRGSYTYSVSQNGENRPVGNYLLSSNGSDVSDRLMSYMEGDTEKFYLSTVAYPVSLGNDVGYGVFNGSLYGWGDNSNGQLAADVTDPYRDTPTLINGLSGIASVAAGKQLSGTDRAFYAHPSHTTFDEGNAFSDNVKNAPDFITGVLDTSGRLSVWSNNKRAITRLNYAGVQDAEPFAAVYSGYGNNLFAVTVRGKLVRITHDSTYASGYNVYIYDNFKDARGNTVTKWEADSTNKVVFKAQPWNYRTTTTNDEGQQVVTKNETAPSLGSATFYVWSASRTSNAPAGEDGVQPPSVIFNNYTPTEEGDTSTGYRPLVKSNAIGDAYRIIGYRNGAFDDSTRVYQKATDLNINNYEPTFWIGDEQMVSTAQRENLFDYEVVNNANGVGIRITPLQSTHGREITVKFYVARYNGYDKFDTTADSAIYYDYQLCEIKFSVDDTNTIIHYDAFGNDLNSNIPLLDPNNPYNKYYSLAVQDVSTGVDELIKYLTTRAATVNTDYKTAILTQMKGEDRGFPDSDKIRNGDLDYYLGATVASAKYNDVYQYLFTDRDADRVVISRLDEYTPIIDTNEIVPSIQTITVTIDISGNLLTALNGEFKGTEITAVIANRMISTDFNNKYGLYNITFNSDMTKLSFNYDVIQFNAERTSGALVYGASDADTRSITDYKTVANSEARKTASILATTRTDWTFTRADGYTVSSTVNTKRQNCNNIAAVFSAASLRIKDSGYGDGGRIPLGDNLVNGKANGGKNTYRIRYADLVDAPLYVGDTVTIELSRFFNVTDTTSMSFTYTNGDFPTGSNSADAFKTYNNQFPDQSGNGMAVVTLSARTLVVKPTIKALIDLDVEIQRFAAYGSGNVPFVNAAGAVDEHIVVTIVFDNILDFELRKTDVPIITLPVTVTRDSVVDVFDTFSDDRFAKLNSGALIDIKSEGNRDITSSAALAALKANAKIFGIKSTTDGVSNPVYTYSLLENNSTVFSVIPNMSGTGIIEFSVHIFDKSVKFSITLNISAATTYNETLVIADDKYITVSNLDSQLAKSNKFNENINNYKILYSDVVNPDARDIDKNYNAIYFSTTPTGGDMGSYPQFIKNVVFENTKSSAPTLRIVSGSSTASKEEEYYMHVRYTCDTTAVTYAAAAPGTVLEMIIPVKAGKVKLIDPNTNSGLAINIDCRNPSTDATWWSADGSGLDVSVTVSLEELLNLIDTASASLYKIFIVRTEDGAADHFDYSIGAGNRTVVITPKNNTEDSKGNPKSYEMSLYVYKDDSSEESRQTIVYSFAVGVEGIVTRLPVMTDDGIIGYGNIWLYSAAIVFGVLLIIFVIRMIVYLKKRSKQRAIIKRNQDLIRLRDRMHNKATAATREQVVKTKLKMEDPKYAKLFNEMRKDKENESGITLENSDLAATAAKKSKKNKNKKGGKKSVAELKAELEAKKAAFAAAQAQNAQPVNPFGGDPGMGGMGGAPFGADPGFGDPGFGGDAPFAGDGGGFGDPGFGGDGGDFAAQDIDGNSIIFDASDVGDGNM